MATRRYNIDLDESHKDVAEAVGSAVASGAVQVTVDLAVVNDRNEVRKALKEVEKYIVEGSWPPA